MPTSIPNFTDDQVFTQMAGLQYWQSLTITYSFPINTTGLTANEGENPSFRPSNSAQQLLFALAIKTWDDLIRNNMVQTSSTSSDIELAYLTHADFFAHAYFPEDGTAWLNASYADLATPVFGQYGFLTMVHELGHTLGLNHMGDYDASRGDLPTPSSYQDSTVFSVMSYFGPGQGDNWPVAQADWIGSDNQTYYPQTPMLNDVMVIQRIYGASTTTRTGNTVYGFGSNLSGADATLYDFTLNRHPIMTLFDSGGVDTLNLSGWQTPSQIDLVAGHYSSVNAMSNNIAIAFGTVIENAVGGGGADRITGNAAANNLDGGVGNDTISGAEGDDTLTGGLGNDQIDGGAGDDLAVLAGSFASYTISYNANANSYTISGSASGTDSYTLVEHFQFSDVQLATGQLLKNDVTAPTLSTSSPADNAIGVAVGANLVLSFSETVVAGSGDIVIYTSAGSVARSIAIGDSSQVSIAGNVVTVNPAGDLAAGSAYYVNIGSGVLKDASGNAFAGISGSGAFNFSTAASADTTAPTLASSSPADNASAVAVNADLVLHFSESVQAGSGNILLYTSGGTLARTIAVTDSSQVSIAGSTVTINPASDLAGASAYYVNMAGGVFKDLAGNAYAGISGSTALNFGTAAALDTTAPVLLTSSPADEASSVAVGANLVLTFSETLQAGSGNILIYNSGGTLERTIAVGDTSQVSIAGSSVTINPSADLAAGASYYVNIASGVLRDVAGNAYAGLNGSGALNFSTAAAGADDYPWSTVTTGVVSVGGAPVGGSIEVRDDADLFRVSLSAGVSYVFNAARTSGGLADPYLQLYGPDVSVLAHDDDSGGSGNARISFTAAASGTYYLGVFDVGSGTGGYTVAAAIADSSAPTLVSSTPADNASAVTVGANLVLSFSEPVRAGSGSFLLYDANGSLAGSIAVGDTSQVSFSGSSVTINPAADLAPGASYYVNIASGVILDLAGNAYAGISGNSALNFSTAAAGGDDYPWSTSTTGVVTVGGAAASGVIEQIDDTDLFRVNLTAGLSYVFDLTRATGGLPDPFLLLFGTDQNNLAVDDDSGGSGNSRISFTAQTSGTYYLGVFDVGSGIGAYRLAAAVITGDTSAPTLISSTPADNATSVGAGADLVLNFSEAVRAGSGNILIYNANGSLARTIAITDSSQVSFSGSHLTLNPSADLDAGASYYLNLASGVVTDFSGNAFAGISGSSALNFSTVADDYPWSTSTGGLVTVGGAASTGVIEAAQDEDLFRVTLVAGTSYVFSLTRATGGLHDPYLELFDAGANALAHDDDSGGAGNARLSFTATSGGTYYLGVSDYASGIGAYSLSAVVLDTAAPRLVSSTPADNASAVAPGANLALVFNEAVRAGAGDIVLYYGNGTVARTISVGDASQVSISGNTVTINPATDLAGASDYYLKFASGVLTDLAGNAYAGIADAATLNFSTASVVQTDDFPLSTSTTGLVIPDHAPLSGRIDFVDDGDLLKVVLNAGTAYVFRATGAAGGLPDPYLVLYNSALQRLVFDDDSGVGLNAEIFFNAMTAGTYYLAVYDASTGTGAYTVSATSIVDDYVNTPSSAGVVSVNGALASGVVNSVGDADMFKVALLAGSSYLFELNRSASAGLVDPFLILYGPDLKQVAYNDDGGGDGNARIGYTVATSGDYYLSVADYGVDVGGYTLGARSVAAAAVLPVVPSVMVAKVSGDLVSGNQPLINGSAEPGVDIRLYSGTTLIGSTRAHLDGSWSYTPYAMANGSYSLTARAADTAGNISPLSGTVHFVVDSVLNRHGGTSADVLIDLPGNSNIDGGAGIDLAVYIGPRVNFTVVKTDLGFVVTDNAGLGGTDLLVNVERVRFGDKTIALDIDKHANGGEAYRIYQAAFDRQPDLGGLGFWMAQIDHGVTLLDVAGGFLRSTEFTSLYGSNPSTDDFVTKLYNNVLHRAPEAGGYKFWVDAINLHGVGRDTVLVEFSESDENIAQVVGTIQNGFEYLLYTG